MQRSDQKSYNQLNPERIFCASCYHNVVQLDFDLLELVSILLIGSLSVQIERLLIQSFEEKRKKEKEKEKRKKKKKKKKEKRKKEKEKEKEKEN